MKKLFIIFVLFLITTLNVQAKVSDKTQIRQLLNDLNKYSNTHNIDAIKKFYSKDYISFDGFNYDAFFVSIDETFKSYPDISYKSKIKSINIFGDYAAVEMSDKSTSEKQTTTQAIVENKPVLNNELNGIMESKSHYITYLKKSGNKWLIYSDSIIAEETSVKYGTALDVDMKISSPLSVNEGEEYCIKLNVPSKPKGSIMLASISREEIKYPPNIPSDIFRKVPSDGILERVVTSNKNGMNEYSLASVGLTEISLNEEKTAINYRMSGIAFLMKRVNVNPIKNAADKEYIKKRLNKEPL